MSGFAKEVDKTEAPVVEALTKVGELDAETCILLLKDGVNNWDHLTDSYKKELTDLSMDRLFLMAIVEKERSALELISIFTALSKVWSVLCPKTS